MRTTTRREVLTAAWGANESRLARPPCFKSSKDRLNTSKVSEIGRPHIEQVERRGKQRRQNPGLFHSCR